MARFFLCVVGFLGLWLGASVWVEAQQSKRDFLHIGSSGALASTASNIKEKAAIKTLQVFIKDETGFANDIQVQKNWRDLAAKMAKGELQLAVLQGYELAWAQEKHPALKPLALAVNVYPYPVAYVVEHKDGGAAGFDGLKGRSLSIPDVDPPLVRLYVERECQKLGSKTKSFFSKIDRPDNSEDALDDVVERKVDAAAVERAALEGYKRRKPGRFQHLKPVAHSEPMPPTVIAYYDSQLDDATLQRCRDGLLNAGKTEKGQMMLTLFRLTRFDPVPADFEKVLAQTRKMYPAE